MMYTVGTVLDFEIGLYIVTIFRGLSLKQGMGKNREIVLIYNINLYLTWWNGDISVLVVVSTP
jgi:hypothetical protein